MIAHSSGASPGPTPSFPETRKAAARGPQYILCLLVIAGLSLAACGCRERKPPAPKPTEVNPVNPEAALTEQDKARVTQAVAMRRGVEPARPALQLRGGEAATPEVLAAFNQELLRARFKRGESPESLEELVRKWRELPGLPTPPPGKRIVYDVRNSIILLDPP